jgi:hypothetical protein
MVSNNTLPFNAPSIQPFRLVPNFSWYCAINFRHSPKCSLRERKSMVYETTPKSAHRRGIKTQKEGTKRIRESKLIAALNIKSKRGSGSIVRSSIAASRAADPGSNPGRSTNHNDLYSY